MSPLEELLRAVDDVPVPTDTSAALAVGRLRDAARRVREWRQQACDVSRVGTHATNNDGMCLLCGRAVLDRAGQGRCDHRWKAIGNEPPFPLVCTQCGEERMLLGAARAARGAKGDGR